MDNGTEKETNIIKAEAGEGFDHSRVSVDVMQNINNSATAATSRGNLDSYTMAQQPADIPDREDRFSDHSFNENIKLLPPKHKFSKSTNFMFETKYVLLNFINLVPKELYQQIATTSPEDLDSLGYINGKHCRPHRSLSKSSDFENVHSPKMAPSYLNRLKYLQSSFDSTSPEGHAGISYRYRKLSSTRRVDSTDSEIPDSDLDPLELHTSSQGFVRGHKVTDHARNSFSDTGLKCENVRPLTSSSSFGKVPQRQHSDMSSNYDYSYACDADDESDDSDTSSVWSLNHYKYRDGFLDLRKSVNVMPPLQSDDDNECLNIDEVDAVDVVDFAGNIDMDHIDVDDFPNDQLQGKTNAVVTKTEGNICNNLNTGESGAVVKTVVKDLNFAVDDVKPSTSKQDEQTVGRYTWRQRVDRSNLKLNIPSEPVQLNDILVSLHSELTSEMEELESELDDAMKSSRKDAGCFPFHVVSPAVTPQTEAAMILARIGDQVKEQYGAELMTAVNRLNMGQLKNLTYKQFLEMSQTIVNVNVAGWRQVALLMVYGQKLMWQSLQQGHQHCHNIVEYCSQLVADVAADFIIKQGGWGSVMNHDPSQSSESQDSPDVPSLLIQHSSLRDWSDEHIWAEPLKHLSRSTSFPSLDELKPVTIREEKMSNSVGNLLAVDVQPSAGASFSVGNLLAMDVQPSAGASYERTISVFEQQAADISRDLLLLTDRRSRPASSVGFDYIDTNDVEGNRYDIDSAEEISLAYIQQSSECQVPARPYTATSEHLDKIEQQTNEAVGPIRGADNDINIDTDVIVVDVVQNCDAILADRAIAAENCDKTSSDKPSSDKHNDLKPSHAKRVLEGYDGNCVYVKQPTPVLTGVQSGVHDSVDNQPQETADIQLATKVLKRNDAHSKHKTGASLSLVSQSVNQINYNNNSPGVNLDDDGSSSSLEREDNDTKPLKNPSDKDEAEGRHGKPRLAISRRLCFSNRTLAELVFLSFAAITLGIGIRALRSKS